MAYLTPEGDLELTREDLDAVHKGTGRKDDNWAKNLINWIIWGENVPPIEKHR